MSCLLTLVVTCLDTCSDFGVTCHDRITGGNDRITGSPRNAVVADVMRRARKEYHNAVRALRLDQHQLHRQKVSQALLANKVAIF